MTWGESPTVIAERLVPADAVNREVEVERVRNRLYQHVRRERQNRGQKFMPIGRRRRVPVESL